MKEVFLFCSEFIEEKKSELFNLSYFSAQILIIFYFISNINMRILTLILEVPFPLTYFLRHGPNPL